MQATFTSKTNYPHPKPASEAIINKAVINICDPIKITKFNFLKMVLI